MPCYISGLSHSLSKIGVYLYHDSGSFVTNSTIHKGCRMYTTFYEDKKKCPRSLDTISLEKAWQYIIQFIMKPVNNNMRH